MKNERGIALVSVLLFLLVLAILVPVTVQMTQTDMKRTKDYRQTKQALFIAEAGLHQTMDGLLDGYNVTNTYSSINDVLNDRDGNDVILGLTGVSFGKGTYTVTVTVYVPFPKLTSLNPRIT